MKESIKKPYLLYLGNDYPHKNLARLNLAFNKLNKENNLDYRLILATEFIEDKELDNLYKNASLYVFPSLSEGFGLPPLEAMTRGVPVASSNTTCLPEILGDAAIYFNPLDVDDMVKEIKKALLDKGFRQRLIRNGFERVKKYKWQETAKKTLEIYQNTLQ